ncbi:unnamed protein product [Closterium sp. NIES-53]
MLYSYHFAALPPSRKILLLISSSLLSPVWCFALPFLIPHNQPQQHVQPLHVVSFKATGFLSSTKLSLLPFLRLDRTLAPPTPEIVTALKAKHPPATEELPDWLSDFSPSEHLRDTFLLYQTHLPHLLRLFQNWLQGDLLQTVRPYFTASNLVALQKPQGGVRPIAIGEILLRLLSRCCQSRALFITSYVDDTYMVGPAHDVFPAYTALTTRLNDLGLRVQPSKCYLWAPLDLPLDITPPSDIIIAPNGLTIVGVPIGSETHIFSKFRDKLHSLSSSLPLLQDLHDPQTATRLLTLCISALPHSSSVELHHFPR